MSKREDYYHIRAGVFKHPEEGGFNKDGNYEWNPHFIERLRDWQGYFTMVLLKPITEVLGDEGWAVYFVQLSQLDESFFVDIYLDDPNNLAAVVSIINAKIPADIKLKPPTLRGNIDAYWEA